MWQRTTALSALGRLRQEDCEFKFNLDKLSKPICLTLIFKSGDRPWVVNVAQW